MDETTNSPGKARENLMSDFQSLATHAQDLLRATASASGEGVEQARARLLQSLRQAGDQMGEYRDYAMTEARRAMKATDDLVHEKPWQAIAGALLVGLMLGALSAGGRK
jgi:ElaB/YqjD/DUF883 family membrane-anchored ribosome-binding protein